MNIMPNNVGWILPPRCAARYTMGVMWRYGVQYLTYHACDPDADVGVIVMNIRNPYSRIRSWLRLWNTTLPKPLSAIEFIENLHSGDNGVQWVNIIENPNGVEYPWKYVPPLSAYIDLLAEKGRNVDCLVRQEHLISDLETIGYPVGEYQNENMWEPSDGQDDIDFYTENPYCAEIVATYYARDFELFGYSKNIGDINE